MSKKGVILIRCILMASIIVIVITIDPGQGTTVRTSEDFYFRTSEDLETIAFQSTDPNIPHDVKIIIEMNNYSEPDLNDHFELHYQFSISGTSRFDSKKVLYHKMSFEFNLQKVYEIRLGIYPPSGVYGASVSGSYTIEDSGPCSLLDSIDIGLIIIPVLLMILVIGGGFTRLRSEWMDD
jgi:hypothetical protein